MSIEIIPNQPVLFQQQGYDDSCVCCEEQGPLCMLIADGDDIYAQVKMTPCGENLICGQPVVGPELITNGNFATNLDDWTVDGGWAWDAGAACATNGQNIGQTITGLVDGATYVVSFSISNYSSDDLSFALGGTVSGPYNADGDYSVSVIAGAANDDLVFGGAGTFNGCIDNVSVRLLPTDCWTEVEAAVDTTVTYNEEGVCVSGSVSLVSTVAGAITGSSVRYVVSFTISDYVSGEVDLQFGSGNTIEGDFTGNGEKLAYDFFITDTALAFVFTDFVGCISDISISLLYPPLFYAVNQETGEIIDLSSNVNFYEDRAILHIALTGESLLSYGCWKFCMVNRCGTSGDELIINGTFNDDLSDWIAGDGWFQDSGEARYVNNGISPLLFQVFEEEVQACVSVEVKKVIGELRFTLIHGGDSVDSMIITEPGVYVLCGLITRVQFSALGGQTNGVDNEYIIDNVSAFEIEDCDECAAWCSNCINYRQSVACDYPLLESYNDENGSYGFLWNDGAGNVVFKLAHRLRANLNNPRYPEESVDYTFSDGSTKDTFAQSDKNWQLFIEKEMADERVHDVVRLQKRSDHLFITTQNGTSEYWAEKGDYNPQWTEPAGSCTAPASFRVGIKRSSLFNNLCSE